MKNFFNNTSGNLRLAALALVLLISLLYPASGIGQNVKQHDYLMPEKGKSMIEIYSGVPYIAVGQYAYGFSKNFSVGLIYGVTPVSSGFGLRFKSVIAQPNDAWRVYMKAPLIYYPKADKGEVDPWVLAWPSFDLERKFNNNSRVWFGVGVVGVACMDFLFDPHEGHDPHEPHEPEEDMVGLFNTFQFGYSKPLSNRSSFVLEVAPVMEGFKLKSESGFLDEFPVIVTLGLSCKL